MKIWAADEKEGLLLIAGGRKKCVPGPCFSVCTGSGRIFCAGPRLGYCLDAQSGNVLFNFSVPPGICLMRIWGNHVIALSNEADCLCAYRAENGEILFSVPAGVYPRDACLSPCGRYLAVAGGAAGEILLFDRDLRCLQRKSVPGVPCAVSFLPQALAVLCAVEEADDLSTRLLSLGHRGAEEEWLRDPATPLSLCAMPGGWLLAGIQDRVIGFSPRRKPCLFRHCPCPFRLVPTQKGPLICDPWAGCIRTPDGKILCTGPAPNDVCLTR